MPRFAANLSFLFTEVPFLERFAEAAHAGFRAVEFAFPYDYQAKELATRIDDCEPKLVISASCGVEPNDRIVHYKPLLDHGLEISKQKVPKCVIVQRDVHRCDMVLGRDFDYLELMSNDAIASPHDAVPVLSTDPHYILYTSGTT